MAGASFENDDARSPNRDGETRPMGAVPDPPPAAAASGWRLLIGQATDAGMVRDRNEDSLYAEPPTAPTVGERGWFGTVADGLGGRPAGEVASALAVQTARDAYYGAQAGIEPAERLLLAVERANRAIYDEGRRSPERAGLATTMTAAAIVDDQLFVAQIGDSRAYLVRDGQIRRLTDDHSWVEEAVRAGALSADEARRHPRRNLVTRVLGDELDIKVDLGSGQLRAGDVLIMSSDGLHGVVEDDEIAAAVERDPQRTARRLVALANRRGGPDNITVLVARLAPLDEPVEVAPPLDSGADTMEHDFGPVLRSAPAAPVAPVAGGRRRRFGLPAGIALTAVVTFGVLVALQQVLGGQRSATELAPTMVAMATSTIQVIAPTALAVAAATPAPPAPTPTNALRSVTAGDRPEATQVVPTLPPPAALLVGPGTPTPSAASGQPAAPPSGGIAARLHPQRPAVVRGATRVLGSEIEVLAPGDSRRESLVIRRAVRGERPPILPYPDEDRTDVWYEIVWPTGSNRTGFIHCSAVRLSDTPDRSCNPPAAIFER